jgi:ketosteroid isomerase-like protein
MSLTPSQTVQTLLSNLTDLKNAKSVTTPDVTYVSLSEHNPSLKVILPWAGGHKGPEEMANVFEGVVKAWETKAFEARDVIEQGDRVAFFGSFTYRARNTGKEVTSLFSLYAKVTDGKVSYVQFMEDTFATSASVTKD